MKKYMFYILSMLLAMSANAAWINVNGKSASALSIANDSTLSFVKGGTFTVDTDTEAAVFAFGDERMPVGDTCVVQLDSGKTLTLNTGFSMDIAARGATTININGDGTLAMGANMTFYKCAGAQVYNFNQTTAMNVVAKTITINEGNTVNFYNTLSAKSQWTNFTVNGGSLTVDKWASWTQSQLNINGGSVDIASNYGFEIARTCTWNNVKSSTFGNSFYLSANAVLTVSNTVSKSVSLSSKVIVLNGSSSNLV